MEARAGNKPAINTANIWLVGGSASAVCAGWAIAQGGFIAALMLIAIPVLLMLAAVIFIKPRYGLIAYIFYCFIVFYLIRLVPGIQMGLGIDAILVITWLGIIFKPGNRYRSRHLNNDLVWLLVAWFALTVLELGNPERPSFQGWLQEMRSLALYGLLSAPLTFFLLNKKKDVGAFLHLIILISVAGALYGMKQLYLGVSMSEQQWLNAGAKKTHILFGRLRVFSFYSEAAQFGASQGKLAIMCLILAAGPYKVKKKLAYAIAGLIIFYGMIISGTRGAMGAIVGGSLVYLVLSNQIKALLVGTILMGGFIGMLKFTYIGQDNPQIRRLRTSVNPDDPSFQVRLKNQKRLSETLRTKPFGTGVGTIGKWGYTFNKHISINAIPPDSLFVKVWVMYGVVGMAFWLAMMFYIIGKSGGIIWKTRDPVLKNQLLALCAGSFGILVCSYGNEVMNQAPSYTIVFISWALIWLSPRWDNPKAAFQEQP